MKSSLRRLQLYLVALALVLAGCSEKSSTTTVEIGGADW